MKKVKQRKLQHLLAVLLIFSFLSFSDKPAYKLYTKKGEEVSYQTMMASVKDADVILFGELHNNPICHWMELTTLKDLHQNKKDLVVGAEMFEADDQLVMDEYLQGKITIGHFSKEAKQWDNFETDYKPLIEYSAFYKLKFVATNIPRRYASLVSREGLQALDSLSEEAKNFIAPLPIEVDLTLPGYKQLDMGRNPHAKIPYMAFMPEAQAIKDATMAHFILKNHSKGKTFLHFNGAYHSQNFEGIYWFIKKKNPSLKVITITSVEQDKLESLEKEYKNTADFILTIPSDMTKTY